MLKHAAYLMLLLLFPSLFTACDPKKNEDPEIVAKKHNDAKFNSPQQEKDAHFLENAAAMCLYEMKMARLAQQNSIRSDVQQKGKVFETEYFRLYKSVSYLAALKTVSLPSGLSDKQEKICADLSFEISSDFDKEYTKRIIDDHRTAIDAFAQEQKETADEEIRAFIRQTLPVLEGNLDLISVLKKQTGISK